MTTAFAASDVVEGVGDVKVAITKEGLDKRSYNPIRDDVFGGNELAYALTGTGISLVTDIVTGAVIVKIPERISASMAAKSAKRAAKKAAQDAAKAARVAEKAEKAAQTVKVAKAAETVEKTEEAAKAVSAAERFYSELDALKLKAREIPHTLTAEEVRACEAVKLQMKGELSAAGRVSVEEVEKIDEAVKAASVVKTTTVTNLETEIEGVTFEGKLYRNVNSFFDPLEMSNYTIQANHRYTEGGIPGLYFSSGEKIVKAELGHYEITSFTNRTMHVYNTKVENMLDLTDSIIRTKLKVSLEDLVGESYEITHSIGRYAYNNGYNGIIAPSARADGGVNVILFDGRYASYEN